MRVSSPLQSTVDYFNRSNQLYHLIFDQQGIIVSMNTLFRNRFSIDWNNRPAADLFSSEVINKLHEVLSLVIQHPEKTSIVGIPLGTNNGDQQLIHWEFSIIPNENGPTDFVQAVGIATKVDEDKSEKRDLPGTEQRLQESELFYRNLFANSLDGVLITDERGKISYASASVMQILGYSVEDILGTEAFQYAHPDDRPLAITAFLDEVVEKPRQKFISIRLIKKSGEPLWCIIRGHNLMQNPYVRGMVVYFYDDTLRKKAEEALSESEKRFRDMIYNLSQGVVLLNDKAEAIVFNRAARRIMGIDENQLFGTTLFDRNWNIIHEDGHDFHDNAQPVQVAINTKKQVRDVVMGIFRPGTPERIWLLVNADPMLDKEGSIINIICSFTDITEQKRLSQELMDQEIQKQKQLVQATIDGQEKERLEIGKELHDNISQHLTTTKLYLEVGREKASDEVLDMINLAHRNVSDIIHELRLLSQSLVPPTLGDLGMIESVMDLCDALKRTHTFQIDFYHRHFSEDKLPGNMKLMLFRIIQEQVNNIIRHAQADTIQIRLQSDAENIFLMIADNGQGFDPSNYKKGLGLTNIANRAELFNGKVEINAAPGEGCSLYISVPLPVMIGLLQRDELM